METRRDKSKNSTDIRRRRVRLRDKPNASKAGHREADTDRQRQSGRDEFEQTIAVQQEACRQAQGGGSEGRSGAPHRGRNGGGNPPYRRAVTLAAGRTKSQRIGRNFQ